MNKNFLRELQHVSELLSAVRASYTSAVLAYGGNKSTITISDLIVMKKQIINLSTTVGSLILVLTKKGF